MQKKILLLFFIPLILYSNDGCKAGGGSGEQSGEDLYLQVTNNKETGLVNVLNALLSGIKSFHSQDLPQFDQLHADASDDGYKSGE